ncbi:ABC transporter ATP-binding protein [Paraburkholderia hospita]|uniref:ABC transporter ATP-binding protein n=1 Tax=Paraburkholderia hospita TaxID=169430 RepID=UPI000DEF7999|nr:ABC transporter ATP-binding protein [Paraburkholderia hospita]AXF00950.1 ABC transporter ATP-binding protein [Paraburkholderia hospita]
MSELRISGLRKAFNGCAVLHDVDLAVQPGTLLALLGPSGGGKTTLLRVLCGFDRADAGTIEIDGKRVVDDSLHVPTEQRRIGYVPQEGALFPHLSVTENIVFGLPRTQRRARHRVAELLRLVGLSDDYAQRMPQQLSGGQQQRVALARALAPSPSLVLLDEPFSSLDAALRLETREAVAEALAATGATAILVTHDQAEALSLGHEVAVLWEGKLIQRAAPQTLYRRPATRELAAFIGDAVLLPGIAENGVAMCSLGRLQLVAPIPDGRVDVMIRPEQIHLLSAYETAADHSTVQDALVTSVTYNGRDADICLQLSSAAQFTIRARVPGHRSPNVGERVRLSVDSDVIAYPHR